MSEEGNLPLLIRGLATRRHTTSLSCFGGHQSKPRVIDTLWDWRGHACGGLVIIDRALVVLHRKEKRQGLKREGRRGRKRKRGVERERDWRRRRPGRERRRWPLQEKEIEKGGDSSDERKKRGWGWLSWWPRGRPPFRASGKKKKKS